MTLNRRNPNSLTNLEVQEFASQVVALTKGLASFSSVGLNRRPEQGTKGCSFDCRCKDTTFRDRMQAFTLTFYAENDVSTKHLDEDRVVAVQWLDECLLILFTK